MTSLLEALVTERRALAGARHGDRCARTLIRGPGRTFDAQVSVAAVSRRMGVEVLESVVVTDKRGPLGIVTFREVQSALLLDSPSRGERAIVQLVTATPCVSPDASVSQICRALLTSRQNAVLVLLEEGELVGVVTSDDVLRYVIASW